MSGFSSTLDTSELDAKLRQVLAEARSQPQALEEVGRVLYQFALNTFREQTDPWGVPWPDWAPATLESRRRRGDYRLQKLVDSRDLLNSIRVEPPSQDSVTLVAGEGLDYAAAQQWGTTTAGRGNAVTIPARYFFPLRTEDEVDIPAEWMEKVFFPLQQAFSEHLG